MARCGCVPSLCMRTMARCGCSNTFCVRIAARCSCTITFCMRIAARCSCIITFCMRIFTRCSCTITFCMRIFTRCGCDPSLCKCILSYCIGIVFGGAFDMTHSTVGSSFYEICFDIGHKRFRQHVTIYDWARKGNRNFFTSVQRHNSGIDPICCLVIGKLYEDERFSSVISTHHNSNITN